MSQLQVDLLLSLVDDRFSSRTIDIIPSSAYEKKKAVALR
ncbi:unnamed protein product [Acidithrix sp. C25]|nr:unnamed protein product [Acidithrix sp. C25]